MDRDKFVGRGVLSSLEWLERICLRTKTYIVLLPWRSWRRSLQLFPAFALAWPTLVRCRMVEDVPGTTGPGPGLGVRDADGSPRRESRTSSRVVEPGLGLFRRRAAVAIASSVSLWPDPNRFHAGVKKETETSVSSSSNVPSLSVVCIVQIVCFVSFRFVSFYHHG